MLLKLPSHDPPPMLCIAYAACLCYTPKPSIAKQCFSYLA